MDSLFSEADLDQELLEIERRKEKRVTEESVVKKSEEKKIYNKKLFIVDGYSLIYRSYFAFLTHPLTDGDGNNVSAYFGFFNTIFMLLKEYSFDYFVIALDSHAPTFRHEMYPAYKATRDAAPPDLHAQVPRIIETLKKMNIPYIAKDGFEADDLIATLARNASEHEIDTIMVTGDKDLMQLVDDHVFALRPPKKGQPTYAIFGAKEVEEEYLVKPNQIVDYLSLLGDSADNVPGVKGIGEKGASKLLAEFVSLDGIYRHLDSLSKGLRTKLEEGKASAYLSKDLVLLRKDVFDLETFDTPEYTTSTIDYAAGVEDFVKAACTGLARSAVALSHGDRSVIMKEAKEAVKEKVESKAAPELLGLGEYIPVTEISTLRAYFEEAVRAGGILAFDTETTDVDFFKAELVGFSFSYEAKKAFYAPISAEGKAYLPIEEVVEVFKEYFESGKLALIGQNIKYDLEILASINVHPAKVLFDTMLAAWLVDANAGVYNLDDLASRYLSYDTVHYSDVVGKGETFADVPLDKAVRYSGEDSDLTFRLYKHFSDSLKEKNLTSIMEEFEVPLIKVLVEMERKGVLLDKVFMKELDITLSDRLDRIISDIYSLAGHEFNINSSQQLAKVLFEERGLETGRKTQRGFSTDTPTLEGLRSSGDPIIENVLAYRGLSKLLSTYVDTLASLCDEEGRIHTSYLQTGTATGRLSSRNPNLQNIPIRSEDGRMIRNGFIPKEGCVFLSADYSQVELVVLAHMTGDKELQKAFNEGLDVHRYTASLIFEKNTDEVTADERRIAKTINFGIMYGMSPFRLSGDLGITRNEAKNFIEKYFIRYSGVKSFVENTVKSAAELGFVKTMHGHVRVVQGINSKNKNEKAAAERVAVNTIIQGTAAEIMKKAMIRIAAEIENRKLESSLLLQVHDELIFEVPLNEVEEMKSLVSSLMEGAEKLSVPLRVSVETGHRWGEMH